MENGEIRHLLRISDLTANEINRILKISLTLKKELKKSGSNKSLFNHKSLAMIFEKPSLRTRVSFEVGMTQLGGHALYLGPNDVQMGKRESVADISQTLCRYVDLIMARVFNHKTLDELIGHATVPVINALSDLEHPCQIMADLLTMSEKKKKLKGLKVAFVGDGENNVTHSLALAAGLLGIDFRIANPKGYSLRKSIRIEAKKYAGKSGGKISEFDEPQDAVRGADVVYTDTWISMGDEAEKEKRLKVFKRFRVTEQLMNFAKQNAVFMHDLPAYRGNEVTSEVIDGPQSIVFDQAENRLHVQKGIMVFLLNKSGELK